MVYAKKLFLVLVVSFFFYEVRAMNLLDKRDEINSFNEKWEFISDQVMGGVSTGSLKLIEEDSKKFLRLQGSVSTQNNGGFIQFRSKFNFAERNFKGLKLKIRGIPSKYYIHITTQYTLLPWQYYSGEFVASENWNEVKIMFKNFKKSNFYQPSKFHSSDIKSIGFVAFGKDFDAQLDVQEAMLIEH